ncbi:hypothetical protein BGW41_004129 [Actinomortierella wolfii]|nr:hypothetical protein BGW41_004129 [Actinomortierella wolfii]
MPISHLVSSAQWWKTWVVRDNYSYSDIPDLTGKVAIVTGANTGLGYATMVALAARGAHVFLACRSKERALEAMERAKGEIATMAATTAATTKKPPFVISTKPTLEFLELDLNDMNKCYRAAKEFLAKGLPLHILVNNSGIMNTPFALTVDGIEQQFGVNHMGHFVFTLALLDRIKKSQPSRIVVLSSMGHELTVKGGIDFDKLNDEKASDPFARYGRSKLANILFAQELAKRLALEKVFVNSCNPGYVNSDLYRYGNETMGQAKAKMVAVATNCFAKSPKKACLTQLYLATSPEVETLDIRGRYFVPIAHEIRPHKWAQDAKLQDRLWQFSEELMREKVKGLEE